MALSCVAVPAKVRLRRPCAPTTILTTEARGVSRPSRKNAEFFRNCYFEEMARPCFRFGSYFLDAENSVLLSRGEPVSIGNRGIAILEALLLNAGHVVPKAALLDAAWPGVVVEESNLSVQIAALRKALIPEPGDNEAMIATVQRVGYRFLGLVEQVPRAGRQAARAPTRRRPASHRYRCFRSSI